MPRSPSTAFTWSTWWSKSSVRISLLHHHHHHPHQHHVLQTRLVTDWDVWWWDLPFSRGLCLAEILSNCHHHLSSIRINMCTNTELLSICLQYNDKWSQDKFQFQVSLLKLEYKSPHIISGRYFHQFCQIKYDTLKASKNFRETLCPQISFSATRQLPDFSHGNWECEIWSSVQMTNTFPI